MRNWAVLFHNFGSPRLIRRTFTRRGAEHVIHHLQTCAPGAVPAQRLYVVGGGHHQNDSHTEWLRERAAS